MHDAAFRLPLALVVLASLVAPGAAWADDAWELHEWGVLEFTPERIMARTAPFATSHAPAAPADPPPTLQPPVQPPDPLGPPTVRPNVPQARKPVIYAVPLSEDPLEVVIDVELSAGAMLETWPRVVAPLASPAARFAVTIHPRACDALEIAPALASVDAHCAALPAGALCEAAELPAWHEADGAACMEHEGAAYPVLVYNGPMDVPAPLAVTHTMGLDGRVVAVRNTSERAVHGVFVREGRQFYRVGTLAPGATFSTEGRTPDLFAGVSDGRIADETRAHLVAAGLAEGAMEDFVRAWMSPASRQSDWDAWGWYEAEHWAAMAPMTASPAPSRTVRVMAFSIRVAH